MKYRTDGISKNRKIRAERKKPLPLGLMKNDYEINGGGIHQRRSEQDKTDMPDVQCTESSDI